MISLQDGAIYETAFYDVELRLFRNTRGGYQVALRTWLDDEVLQMCPTPPTELVSADPEGMPPRSYGELLYKWLFQDEIQVAFERARWSTPSRSSFSNVSTEGGLRFFLALAEDLPPEIIRLRWEALHAPDGYLPFSMSTAFARLTRVSARARSLITPTPLRVLQITSAPSDLAALDSAPLTFMDRLRKRPWGAWMELNQVGPRATLAEVRTQMQQDYESYHIVYVVTHTQWDGKETHFVLTNEQGLATLVSAEALIDCLAPPTGSAPALVFLATPPTAQVDSGQSLLSLAPRLLSAGVRFVVVLQGPLSSTKLARFSESFFTSLLKAGLVDVAMASARFEMIEPDQPMSWDWAYPVLFLRTHGSSLLSAGAEFR